MDSTVLLAIGILLGVLVGVGVTAAVFSYRIERQPSQQEMIAPPGSGMIYRQDNTFNRKRWWADWAKGLSTEMGGAVITTILLGVVLSVVQEYRAQEQHKAELILQMGSPDNGFALEATRQLRALGWLEGEDSFLRGSNLTDANLQGADLRYANLQGVDLRYANLQGARLEFANLEGAGLLQTDLQRALLSSTNLQGADLVGANLGETWLFSANLQRANLGGTNLQCANLAFANLKGADLWDANLQGGNLEETVFDEATRLPDKSLWTPSADLARFTDPSHPNFWYVDASIVPAFPAPDHAC